MSSRKSFAEFCSNMISRIRNFLVNAEKLGETIKRPKEVEVSYQLPPALPIPDNKKLEILMTEVEIIKGQTTHMLGTLDELTRQIDATFLYLKTISEKIDQVNTKENSEEFNALVEKLKQSTDALSSTVNNERKNENA